MTDKFDDFFSQTDFDIQVPHEGHTNRFQNKLNNSIKKTIPWKWMSAAASIVLCLGFWLGANHQKKQLDLADVSPKMEEVQNYFVNTIRKELKQIEANRNLSTEATIEQALDELEELEETYQLFVKELTKKGNQQQIIASMIGNYQQRLQILENVMQQIQIIKNPQRIENENFI